jgi:hypothetical protein
VRGGKGGGSGKIFAAAFDDAVGERGELVALLEADARLVFRVADGDAWVWVSRRLMEETRPSRR